MTILSILLWIGGTLGVGGTVAIGALFVFAPALATVILQGVINFVKTVVAPLVVAIVKKIVGTRAGVGAVCFIVAWIAADQHRATLDQETFRQDNLQAELAVKADDLKKARDAAADAKLRLADLQRNLDDDKRSTADYVADLRKRVDAGCVATDADVDPGGVRNAGSAGTRAGPAGEGRRSFLPWRRPAGP